MNSDTVESANARDATVERAPVAFRRPVWGMTCAACASELTDAISVLPGVQSVTVNPVSHWMELQCEPGLAPSCIEQRVNEAIAPLGCHVLDASAQAQRDASRRSLRRSLFGLLVCVLLWMQIMMYAWPEYSWDSWGSWAENGMSGALHAGVADTLTAQDRLLLRWGQWMLALPLMVWCAAPVLRSAWQGLRRGRPGLDLPSAFALLAAFVVSTEATFSGDGSVWFDSLSMFLMFLLAARHVLEWLRHAALMSVLGAQDDLPERACVLDDSKAAKGEWITVPLQDVKVGDICRVRTGELLPADGVILDDESVVTQAMISGESLPVGRQRGESVWAGSRLLSADLRFRVTATGARCMVGQIRQHLATAMTSRPAHVVSTDRMAWPLLAALLLVSVVSGVWAEYRQAGQGMTVGLAVLMVSCPCAISLAAPVAWIVAAMHLRHAGLIVRDVGALQTVNQLTDVVLDKTGTLTGALTVRAFKWQNVRAGQAGGSDYVANARAVLWGLCLGVDHPLSQAISAYLDGQAWSPVAHLQDRTEVPGCGIEAIQMTGADQCILRWRLGNATWCGIATEPSVRCSDTTANASDAQSHVYLSCRQDDASDVWTAICRIDIEATLRPGTQSWIDACRARGLRLHLWSGDRIEPVMALADQLNIEDARAGLLPHQKLDALQALRASGARVLMVGDGLNDAPVLAAADVSVAMSHGSLSAQQHADAILVGGDLSVLGRLLSIARSQQRIAAHNVVWAVAYNLIAVPFAALGWLTPLSAGIGMAASSALVTCNALRLFPVNRKRLQHGYSVFADSAVSGDGVCNHWRAGVERERRAV